MIPPDGLSVFYARELRCKPKEGKRVGPNPTLARPDRAKFICRKALASGANPPKTGKGNGCRHSSDPRRGPPTNAGSRHATLRPKEGTSEKESSSSIPPLTIQGSVLASAYEVSCRVRAKNYPSSSRMINPRIGSPVSSCLELSQESAVACDLVHFTA